jgi:ribonucleoside-diphosphate reductase beta chain
MVDLEDSFIELVYSQGEVEGLSKQEVKQYIRYIADIRLTQLGLEPIFGVDENPLPWVDVIVFGKEHTNFFENRATDYSKGAIEGNWEDAFS